MKSIGQKVAAIVSAMMLFLSLSPPETVRAAYTNEALANASAVDVIANYDQVMARELLPLLNEFRANPETGWVLDAQGRKQYVKGLEALTYDYGLEQIAMQRVVEPGEFELQVGASSEDIRLKTIINYQ